MLEQMLVSLQQILVTCQKDQISYYTNARADARVNLQTGSNLDLSSKNTGDLSEGSNLYYTNARADARIAAASTSDLSEGTNLYYTDARADARVALVVDSAPGTLNTLNELAAALGDDANFSTTVTNSMLQTTFSWWNNYRHFNSRCRF